MHVAVSLVKMSVRRSEVGKGPFRSPGKGETEDGTRGGENAGV